MSLCGSEPAFCDEPGVGVCEHFVQADLPVAELSLGLGAVEGKIHRPKMSIGDYGFCTLAIDSEGNMIGLHSMK